MPLAVRPWILGQEFEALRHPAHRIHSDFSVLMMFVAKRKQRLRGVSQTLSHS